ncbi:MAG: hypothetical protein R3211_06240 [Balneolaceae bacterium]|nr:hypothetical protein [Balneolaceae bacterium]
MRKRIADLMIVGGGLALIYYGYRYWQETSHFEALGAEVVISQGDTTPLIIAAIVIVAGLLLRFVNKN